MAQAPKRVASDGKIGDRQMIKFPKVHIATSVVNRLLNVADGLPDNRAPAEVPPPAVPDTMLRGAQLDQDLSQPIGPVGGLDQAPDPGATASGAPLLQTMLTGGDK